MTRIRRAVVAVLLLVTCSVAQSHLQLTRAVRNWEFLPVVGQRAALLGNEDGRFEAWVYPMKLFRDLRFTFRTPDRVIPAEDLARVLTVRPESATITYTWDTFSVRQKMFVPVGQSGAVILLEVETRELLQITASFQPEFSIMWPGSIGGTYSDWNKDLHAFTFGHERKEFFGVFGSPAATTGMPAYWANSTERPQSTFELPAVEKGRRTYVLAVAASTKSAEDAQGTYRKLCGNYAQLETDTGKYYADYLLRTVSLDLPDKRLQQAYDWARVSTIQGLVESPLLGTGLIAGYKTSGGTQRPGFAWFFGRDSFWTDLALNSISDFSTTRTALEFISKFQRDDGKMPHEISQSASLVDWSKFPYQFSSADATPLYIIAFRDYVTASGDVEFARAKWDSLQRAYNFLRSTWDDRGLPKNEGVGHGWVEGGPLRENLKTELYQSALGWAAIRDFDELAKLAGKSADIPKDLEQRRKALDDTFWLADKNYYAFGLHVDNSPVNVPSVEATVPMWFDVLNPARSEQMIRLLASEDQMADWGMRINSVREPFYFPQGYHYGAVWPLFTGWASVGEYKVHRPDAAYANLRANALLAFDGPLGHFTEVMSGDYYQTIAYGSPHQIWSAAMVLSPILRGMLGLKVNAQTKTVALAPHLPSTWERLEVNGVKVGGSTVSFTLMHSASGYSLETRNNGEPIEVIFEPAISLRAKANLAEVNRRVTKLNAVLSTTDQHVQLGFAAANGTTVATIHVTNDFGLDYAPELPPYGTSSRNLKFLSQTWSDDRNTLTLSLSGRPGQQYNLALVGSTPNKVEGASIAGNSIVVQFPESTSDAYQERTVILQWSKP